MLVCPGHGQLHSVRMHYDVTDYILYINNTYTARIHLSCLRKWEVIIGVQGYSQRHDNFIGWGTAKVISISILLFCPRVGRGNIACYDHIIAVPLRLSASSKRGDRLGDVMVSVRARVRPIVSSRPETRDQG